MNMGGSLHTRKKIMVFYEIRHGVRAALMEMYLHEETIVGYGLMYRQNG